MSSAADQLAEFFGAELATLQVLDDALENEYNALMGNDVDALEEATAHKDSAIRAHREQQGRRIDWMLGLGLDSTTSTSDLLDHCGATGKNSAIQRELAGLGSRCQESNLRNGGLIVRLQERARNALDVLRREDHGGDLYSLSGSREHHSDSRILGKA